MVRLFLVISMLVFATDRIGAEDEKPGSLFVFTNQNESGQYLDLVKGEAKQIKIPNASLHIDAVSLEDAFDSYYELWSSGEVRLSLAAGTALTDVKLDEYNAYGDYLQTHILPGTNIDMLVELQKTDGTTLFSGYQPLALRKVADDSYSINFQLVYSVPKSVLTTVFTDVVAENMQMRFSLVSDDPSQAMTAPVLPSQVYSNSPPPSQE